MVANVHCATKLMAVPYVWNNCGFVSVWLFVFILGDVNLYLLTDNEYVNCVSCLHV